MLPRAIIMFFQLILGTSLLPIYRCMHPRDAQQERELKGSLAIYRPPFRSPAVLPIDIPPLISLQVELRYKLLQSKACN